MTLKFTGNRRRWIIILTIIALWTARAGARDVFVLLSGGVSPSDNNYSQYLQARAMSAYFLTNYPSNSVWMFFGAGNVEGARPVISDVYREMKIDSNLVSTWLPGVLPRNRPATREEFLPALRKEILPAVAGGGTLFLFVGDHGSRTHGANPESLIDLWSLLPDKATVHGWSERNNEDLGVSELRRLFSAGLGKGHVVFCMTQCHSGGFHFVGIPHDMPGNSSWFVRQPSWLKKKPREIRLPVAGFAATDELSLASGCNPDPDPEHWAGYERHFPEALLGDDIFSSIHHTAPLPSFASAHTAATLVDRTIDKPYSTSDQYLECWAEMIEAHLLRESALVPRVKRAVADYVRAVNGARLGATDAALRARALQFEDFIKRLGEQNPKDRQTLLSGTRAELEEIIYPPGDNVAESQQSEMAPSPGPRRGRGRGGAPGPRRLWTQVKTAWQSALDAGQIEFMPAKAGKFEDYLLNQTDGGFSALQEGPEGLRDRVYWYAGYGEPATLDTNQALAISLWATVRREKILGWASTNSDQAVRNAAFRLSETYSTPHWSEDAYAEAENAEQRSTAADRVLFYRRVLAAWQFLLQVDERPALGRLRELAELERTPLPKPKAPGK